MTRVTDEHENEPHARSAPPMIELRGVRAGYDEIEVLHGVDLAVPPAALVAVLGPNGAGKTTTLRTLAGLHPITHGQIWIAGRDITGADPTTLARLGVCSIPEGRGVFPNLTVRENLWMATFRGSRRSIVEEKAYAQFPSLARRRDAPAGRLSGGEQQMLAVARAITTDPPILILDELSMGLAPVIVEDLYRLIADLRRSGTTILVVEQFAQAVLGIADLAAVMVHGRIAMSGPPDDIQHDLAAAYLGEHPHEEEHHP